MKTALYLRVSTADQSTENQLPDLEALASRRGFDIVRIFSENVSAVKARPEFEKMISGAHRGKFEVLVEQRPDRAPRRHKSLRLRQRGPDKQNRSSRFVGRVVQGST